MKLRELIEKIRDINPDELIAIGAASSFMYFGEPDYKEIDKVSKGVYKESELILQDIRANLKGLPAQKDALDKKVKEAFELYRDIILNADKVEIKRQKIISLEGDIKKLINRLYECEQRRSIYNRRIKELVEYRSNYTPLLDREVIRHYRQEESDYAYAIIIDGIESGHYWTKREYDLGLYEEEEKEDE